ncbi:hypothetical protein GPECTOR_17g988 [Gonium pectorale]|uniref:Uncharacterized protein n=1 Tax=Gonium pectorale TaxID=33097 RepID=A0A150GKM9_GONPE|nr:hypothetical protein GPECTOR_17g988 [Gonium pectorale]|eukprot:KXZ50347.1 hypothetical protein GPECTOR_17g988 [Gonium pectorale]
MSFASTFTVRVVSGKAWKGSDARSDAGSDAGADAGKGLTGFLSKKAENVLLVDKLVKAAKLNCTASEFADFTDGNFTLRNDDYHNSVDAALIKKAEVLKKAGALRLLHDDFSWQCSIIENIEALLECLNEAS